MEKLTADRVLKAAEALRTPPSPVPTQPNSSLTRPISCERPKADPEVLEALGNYLLLNPKSVSSATLVAWAVTLSAFPPLEVRAALATCAHNFATQVQLDVVLRTLADRLWQEHALPPPTDLALDEIRKHTRRHSNLPPEALWSHPLLFTVVKQFGWDELYWGQQETEGVRRAQIRKMYEYKREREVSLWIAQISLGALPTGRKVAG